MKTSQKITVVALLVLIRFSAFSQTSMDLGLKINSAPKNKYQLEFRKFFNEKIAFRLALVAGNESYGIQDRMLGANDSMVIVRRGSEFHENYELRVGMESKLG